MRASSAWAFVVIARRTCCVASAKRVCRKKFCTARNAASPFPAYRWLQTGLDKWAGEQLLGTDSRVGEAFDREEIARLIAASRAGEGDAAHRVWMLIVLEYWLRAWDVRLD